MTNAVAAHTPRNNMTLTIRQEQAADYPAVHELVEDAFRHAEHTDHDEQNLVNRLRETADFIPELALVAELDGRLAGHIMFSTVRVGEATALCLAPVSVSPDCQGKGVGSALIREGHRRAAALGHTVVILVGHEQYYPRFDYVPAGPFGLQCPFPVPAANFMVCFLDDTPRRLDGVVAFSRAFG